MRGVHARRNNEIRVTDLEGQSARHNKAAYVARLGTSFVSTCSQEGGSA
jgi:hypothetical protein